jgi:hypothetical protein
MHLAKLAILPSVEWIFVGTGVGQRATGVTFSYP